MRRTVPRPGPKWVQSLRRREALWAACYALVFTLLAGAIAIWSGGQTRYRAGQVVTEPIVSRVAFEAIDRQETEAKQQAALSRVPPVYLPNTTFYEALEAKLTALLALADNETIEQVPAELREQVHLTPQGLAELQEYKRGEGYKSPEMWSRDVQKVMHEFFSLAVLRSERYKLERNVPSRIGRITIMHPAPRSQQEAEQIRRDIELYNVEDVPPIMAKVRPIVEKYFPPPLHDTVLATVERNLQPTYVHDPRAQELTKRRQQEAYAAAGAVPETTPHQANTVIVPPGTTLDETHLNLIKAERAAYQAQLSPAKQMLRHVGVVGVMLLIAIGLWAYTFYYNERIVRNPMRGLAITALLLLCQALAVTLTQLHPGFVYVTATFPTLLAAIVLTIAYDQRYALGIAALHTVLVMVSLGLSVGFVLVLLAGVGMGVGLLREVRTRSTVVLIGVWSGLAMATVTLLAGFAERPLHLESIFRFIGSDAALALGSGFVTGLLVQGVLPAIESVFKVTTAMTLRELNDASHPLLQRLAQEAPGTYQHSLRIADMAEAAADSIGGDGLLCRVGAMYHDIGKINKPQYFIENQGGGPNRHAKLSPAMSLLIIVGHVKDGIEMAREYRLPQPVRHFIESHHGTTLVEYFYHAARKQKEAEEAPAPSEFEFRYPGPKPQTKEAAIMLLCDSIEAAARTLPEPTPVRLEQLVHKMAMKRLMDGQFDECNLTLQELNRIEGAITKTLCAIYHARVKYPGGESQPAVGPRAAEAPTPAPPRVQPAAS